MYRSRCPALGLQLAHNRRHAPNILLIFCGPFIGKLTHRRRWRDWINCYYFIGFVSNVSRGLVAIDCHGLVSHYSLINSCLRACWLRLPLPLGAGRGEGLAWSPPDLTPFLSHSSGSGEKGRECSYSLPRPSPLPPPKG